MTSPTRQHDLAAGIDAIVGLPQHHLDALREDTTAHSAARASSYSAVAAPA